MLIFAVYVGYRSVKESGFSKNALKPVLVTTSLSPQKTIELLKASLPDIRSQSSKDLLNTKNEEEGFICEIRTDESKPNNLYYGITGYGGLLGTINVTLHDGSNRDCIATFRIEADHSSKTEGKTAVAFITTKWSQKKGQVSKYKLIINAQNKFVNIITQADPNTISQRISR